MLMHSRSLYRFKGVGMIKYTGLTGLLELTVTLCTKLTCSGKVFKYRANMAQNVPHSRC